MDAEQTWTPLLGVMVGGGLSYVAQLTTGRTAARAEDRRQAVTSAEASRSERLDLLREFIQLAQEGIRLAEEARCTPDAPAPEWREASRALIDRLRVAEHMVKVLFDADFHRCAYYCAAAVDEVLREHRQPTDEMWTHLREPQHRFL